MVSDSVKSLMNSRVISVLPETPVLAAIDILLSNNYNGIPVVDKNNMIAGILTKYDLIVKKDYIRDDSKVKDVMNKEPLVLADNMTVEDAIRAFSEHHRVDPIPVIDVDKKVIGIITRVDMVKLFREYGLGSDISKSAIQTRASIIWPWVIVSIFIIFGVLYYIGFFESLGLSL